MAKLNKATRDYIDDFLMREKTGSITKTPFGTSMELFKHIEETKKCIGFLRNKGIDAFKRGTKEPERAKEVFEAVKWEEVKDAQMVGTSMWD